MIIKVSKGIIGSWALLGARKKQDAFSLIYIVFTLYLHFTYYAHYVYCTNFGHNIR